MTTVHCEINATEWAGDATWIRNLIPVTSIQGHTAYDTSRHDLFTASELQEQLVALGWPAGNHVDTADDTPPCLSVTLELEDDELAALQRLVDDKAAGTITIDVNIEFENGRHTADETR